MSLEDLFCDVDEFRQVFLPAWHRQLLTASDYPQIPTYC
mgnify:CR=1 FL=1